MKVRKGMPRNRDLQYEQSLKNPLFLHHKFNIESVKLYFKNLCTDKRLKIYDFGCGQKPYYVFASNHEYIGIDIDNDNDKADIYSDIVNTPIEDNIADIVVSFYVLEHVEDPQRVLNEKYRVLKQGGELYMLVPLYWEEHEQPYDYYRFTRFSLEKMLKNSGFKNIKIKELSTDPAILGLNLAKFFNRKFFRIFIPAINLIFYKLQVRNLKIIRQNETMASNVMSFAVTGSKP